MAKWVCSKYNGYYTCSECANVYVDKLWATMGGKWLYCPHCGAKMDVDIASTEGIAMAKNYAPIGQEDYWA